MCKKVYCEDCVKVMLSEREYLLILNIWFQGGETPIDVRCLCYREVDQNYLMMLRGFILLKLGSWYDPRKDSNLWMPDFARTWFQEKTNQGHVFEFTDERGNLCYFDHQMLLETFSEEYQEALGL